MPKYHINPDTGNANVCTAKVKCKFTSEDGVEPPHYESKIDARAAAEQQLSSTHSAVATHKSVAKSYSTTDDPRTVEELTQAVADGDEKDKKLKSVYDNAVQGVQSARYNYNVIHEGLTSANTKESKDAFWSLHHANEALSTSHENLLRAEYETAENRFILDKKQNPNRTKERSEVLAVLTPTTKKGKTALKRMKQNFADSEKELIEAQRETHALNEMRAAAKPEDIDNPEFIAAGQRHYERRQERIHNHARAVSDISKMARYYERIEGLPYDDPSLQALKASKAESDFAYMKSVKQADTWVKIQSEQDDNVLRNWHVNTLEKENSHLPFGAVERRKEIMADVETNKVLVESRKAEHKDLNDSVHTTKYRGFSKD